MDSPQDIEVLIFDFDGTLHDLNIDWHKVRKLINIDGTNEKIGEAIDRFKKDDNHTALQAITDHEMQATSGKNLDSGTVSILKRLQSDYQLAILTRNSRKVVEAMLKKSGLSSVVVVGREDVNKLKPQPEGLEQILKKFGHQPKQALLIGDTFHDVLVAKAAAISSVIIGQNYKPGGYQPDYRIESIKDLILLLGLEK